MGEKKTLKELTKKTIDVLKNVNGSSIDISFIAQELQTEKRRLYDIINVLQTAGVISKNNLSKVAFRANESFTLDDDELSESDKKERELDQLLTQIDYQIEDFMQSELFARYGYITDDDISALTSKPAMTFLTPKNSGKIILTNQNGINGQNTHIHCKSETEIPLHLDK